MMVLAKANIEAQLLQEQKDIESGRLKDDTPLDFSEQFHLFCEACRSGDLKSCQLFINSGINVNARDKFDYTPLILASLCGHYEIVELLLESGALCERDTFQGERCIYNALNDHIRNLLVKYDFSKSTDPLQPLASHVSSLLSLDHPRTSDITVKCEDQVFHLHKFILSARSPYFERKLAGSGTEHLKRLPRVPVKSFELVLRYIYLDEIAIGHVGPETTEEEVLAGIDRLSKFLEIPSVFENLLDGDDRRLARQRRSEEIENARKQFEEWFLDHVLKYRVELDKTKVAEVRWDRDNSMFADVLLQADEVDDDDDFENSTSAQPSPDPKEAQGYSTSSFIPVGPLDEEPTSKPVTSRAPKSVLFPAHKAMLIRSEYFRTMFSSAFKEAQETEYLQIIPVDCSPKVLETILFYLYSEQTDFPLELALDVLYAADLLFIDKLKKKAALVIDTLGDSSKRSKSNTKSDVEIEFHVFDVLRAGWFTKMERLESFSARYIAHRLEHYIDDDEFAQVVSESASRIKDRQATDTIELIDDIRSYLDKRFRMRFEESGISEMVVSNLPPDRTVPEYLLPPKGQSADEGKASEDQPLGGTVEDRFADDAVQYEILLGKLDALLEKLGLDA